MTKVKPTTKEQLVYYLLQNISLGTYDRRFLTNLQTTNIQSKKPATSNQAELLTKITTRYARQLQRQEIDATEMVKLPWGVEPIDSLPEYTDAFCSIKDDVIEIRSPYKKDFITDIKDTRVRLEWNKDTRIWSGPLCEETLSHFIECLDKHYHVVRYCPAIVDIINMLVEYEPATCWDPTYKYINGNFLVAGINPHIELLMDNLILDASPTTLAKLHSAGVIVSDEVKQKAIESLGNTDSATRLVEFATSSKPIVGLDDIPELVDFLEKIECDCAVIMEVYRGTSSNIGDTLRTLFSNSKVPAQFISRKTDKQDIDIAHYKYPVLINTALWGGGSQETSKLRVSKAIHLGNNKPIEIK